MPRIPVVDLRLPGLGLLVFVWGSALFWLQPVKMLADPAIGRHVAAGRALSQGESVGGTDPLSFGLPGERWIDFEWMFDLVAARLDALGRIELCLWTANVVAGLTLVVMLCSFAHRRLPLLASLAGTLLVLATLTPHLAPRPVLVSYLFFAVLVLLNQTGGSRARWKLWLLTPVLFAFWANIHPGFVAGLLLLGAYGAGDAVDRWRRGRWFGLRAWLARRAGLFVLAVAATFINPYGPSLYSKIGETIFQIKTVALLQESQPLTLDRPDFWTFLILGFALAALALAFSNRWRGVRCRDVLPGALFASLAVGNERHAVWLCLGSVGPLLTLFILDTRSRWPARFKRRLSRRAAFSRSDGLAIAAYVAMTAGWLVAHRVSRDSTARLWPDQSSISPDAIHAIGRLSPSLRRPITTTTNAGAILYWFWPDIRVSFDDRFDFYRDAYVQNHLLLLNAGPGWRAVLAAGNFDSAILEPELPLAQALRTEPGWTVAYEDAGIVVLRRAAP